MNGCKNVDGWCYTCKRKWRLVQYSSSFLYCSSIEATRLQSVAITDSTRLLSEKLRTLARTVGTRVLLVGSTALRAVFKHQPLLYILPGAWSLVPDTWHMLSGGTPLWFFARSTYVKSFNHCAYMQLYC